VIHWREEDSRHAVSGEITDGYCGRRASATGQNVQSLVADAIDEDRTHTVACLAFTRVHLIYSKTERVIGFKKDDE
jgi:hypothetical protein